MTAEEKRGMNTVRSAVELCDDLERQVKPAAVPSMNGME